MQPGFFRQGEVILKLREFFINTFSATVCELDTRAVTIRRGRLYFGSERITAEKARRIEVARRVIDFVSYCKKNSVTVNDEEYKKFGLIKKDGRLCLEEYEIDKYAACLAFGPIVWRVGKLLAQTDKKQ